MMPATCLRKMVGLFLATLLTQALGTIHPVAGDDRRPNLVLAIADDWGWPHAGVYQDQAVATPNFDAIAEQGVLFQHAFVSSPSCTPSRGAIITGQHFWRLGPAANLWSEWPANTFSEYPQLLREAGYFVGHYRKAWGPGKFDDQPAGKTYQSPQDFLDACPAGQPFCFWFGTSDPHRGYLSGSGKDAGIALDRVHLFAHFPDTAAVRNDVADYYFEVQRFDRELGQLVKRLSDMGEWENTLIVVTSDHGMPFPRCKTNLYDSGTRVPLAIRGPGIPGGRLVDDFVSLTDLAPTFLQAAGVKVPAEMTGQSLLPLLTSKKSGRVDPTRDYVLFGRERHTVSQQKGVQGGYPMRAIRNADFLYIRNFHPERWPAGTPDYQNAELKQAWLSDCDNGPTKTALWEIRGEEPGKSLYELCFGKRPAEELYDLSQDPGQLVNVAAHPEYAIQRKTLATRLENEIRNTGDPRADPKREPLDESGAYLGGGGGQWIGDR